jgi:Ni/Co efflux regulator RcnB
MIPLCLRSKKTNRSCGKLTDRFVASKTRGDFMTKFHIALGVAILSASLAGPVAIAQDHHDNHAYVEHKEWKKGAVIRHEDWQRAEVVDYRQYHLKPPPRGYEWRLVDGQYVLVNSSNFHISMVVRVP